MNDLKTYPGTYPHNWQLVLLHQYLLQHSQISPDAIAIIFSTNQWTYQDLSNYSYTYADILDDCGLAAGDRIILELEASPQAIALIAACSLLGLVFVPVSPASPPTRIEQILLTTEAKLHIKTSSNEKSISNSHPRLQGFLEGNSLQIKDKLPEALRSRRSPVLESDLAYIIFTSGTTGNPKGIMMTHRAVLAFFRALVNYCQLTPEAKVGTIAPLQFDFSLLDMGLALGSGATLVQIPQKLTLIPPKFMQYLQQHQVTQMNSVPSIWKILLQYAAKEIAHLKHLKTILFAGEPFSISEVVHLQSLLPKLRIINCFGQSESIACSFTEVPNPLPPNSKNLSIGFAHPGAEMLLLDDKKKEINQPNQVGEIYLRGANLFSGYWRNTKATNEALIPNPLNPLNGEKIFRTGDLAYKGSQGELYLKGRRDLQVKIRGNRVELEEIEQVLNKHEEVIQAIVVVFPHQKEPILTAYVVPQLFQSPPEQQILCKLCADVLPNYMIPTEIIYIESLPTNVNGKVDRQALIDYPPSAL